MTVEELCLVPRRILDKLGLNQSVTNNKENVYILDKKKSFLPYSKPSDYKTDLKDQLKTILKSNFDKGYSIFLWLKNNEKNFEYLHNGELIAPISNLNILNFINDAVSRVKSISQDQLNKYKLFVSVVNLPEYFIINKKMKEYLFPDTYPLINTRSKKTKKRPPINGNNNDNNDDDDNDNGTGLPPIPTRSKKRKTAAGNIKYITTINPLKMKNYKKKKNNKNQWINV